MRRVPPILARAARSRWARAAFAVAALPILAWAVFERTPATLWVDPARFVQPRDAFSVVDRHGHVLRQSRTDGVDRRWVALEDVAPCYLEAVLATEDARFREHGGVDVAAMARALATDLWPWGRRSGASTLTQQLVKLVYGRPLGAASKALEVVRAAALERLFGKDRILEQYVNRVPFGDRIEGVERASEEYFGHPARSLTVSEAALLAGIPQAPSVTEPRRHLARALRRREHVLDRMAALGKIDEATRARLVAEAPAVLARPARPNEAPRFVDAALALANAGRLARVGSVVSTSLDASLQRQAEATLADGVARFEARGVTNGAAVVVDNATGEILAYVGAARTGPQAPGGTLDLLTRARQPGSTLKPFVYELLFERGGTAATVLDDVARARRGAAGTQFDAKDYDGYERGPVRARVALGSSLNLAALDAAGRVGETALVQRLKALGFQDLHDADRYGAAAVLGGLDVTPLDLADAYVTLARGGTRVPLVLAPGPRAPGKRVMSADAAEVARDVLTDAAVRRDAFGADLEDLAAAPFALKTGTSTGWRDAWAAVFDRTVTVVVWLGDPAGRPLGAVAGFEAAAPLAVRIHASALAHRRTGEPATPDAPAASTRLVPVTVCAETGLLPGPRCHHPVVERFAPGTVPWRTCAAHDEDGRVRLPAVYADWIARTHPTTVADAPLVEASAGERPVVREPRNGAQWLVDAAARPGAVRLRAGVASGELPETEVAWEIDGAPVRGARWEPTPGAHVVVAVWRARRSRPARVDVEGARNAR